MIISFKDSQTAAIFAGALPAGLTPDLCQLAQRRLQLLQRATALEQLRWPHFDHLIALDAPRAGQHSLNVNATHRICFVWKDTGVLDVELTLHSPAQPPDTDPLRHSSVSRPGDVLREEIMRRHKISALNLARMLGSTEKLIRGILQGTHVITPRIALALSQRFALSGEFWLLLQMRYSLQAVRQQAAQAVQNPPPA